VITTPKVSVIIPTFNRANYITQCIDSVFNQTFQDFEIIVTDDGSTDDTKEVLKPYFDKIKYIYKENGGCASARNCGINNSAGEYLTFLDSDDLFEIRKLETQVPILEENIDVGFVYSDSLMFFEDSDLKERLVHAMRIKDHGINFAKQFFPYPKLYMPTTLIRKRCIESVGQFDEELRHNEDTDLLIRIALNWEVKFSEYPSAKIRHHPGRKSLDRIEIYRCLIKSATKILNCYPDFRDKLGEEANIKIADLHNRLAHEYLANDRYKEARREFYSYLKTIQSFKFNAYFYVFIISLGSSLTKISLKVIRVFKNIMKEVYRDKLRRAD